MRAKRPWAYPRKRRPVRPVMVFLNNLPQAPLLNLESKVSILRKADHYEMGAPRWPSNSI